MSFQSTVLEKSMSDRRRSGLWLYTHIRTHTHIHIQKLTHTDIHTYTQIHINTPNPHTRDRWYLGILLFYIGTRYLIVSYLIV